MVIKNSNLFLVKYAIEQKVGCDLSSICVILMVMMIIPDICHFFSLSHENFTLGKCVDLRQNCQNSIFLEYFYTQPKILHSRRSRRS